MTREKRQTKASVHYVNNKEFTAAIIAHNHACRKADKKGVEKPRVTEYIGECIYKIATRLSTKPNFINYSYRICFVSVNVKTKSSDIINIAKLINYKLWVATHYMAILMHIWKLLSNLLAV